MKNNKIDRDSFDYSKIKESNSLEEFWEIVGEELEVVSDFEESLFLILDNTKLKDLSHNISIEIDSKEESLLTTAINSSFAITTNDIDNSFSYNIAVDNPLNLNISHHQMIIPLVCSKDRSVWSLD